MCKAANFVPANNKISLDAKGWWDFDKMHVEVGRLVLIRPSLFTFDVYQLIGMARCESHSFPPASNQFTGEKLGEQMIPIIRKPTVLITIPRTTEPAIPGLAQPPAPPSPARGPGEGTLLLPARPAPRSARGPATSPLCHRRSKGDASPAGHLVLHSISQGLRLLPTPLPFFPLLFFV